MTRAARYGCFENKNGEINSERVHYPALSTQWGGAGIMARRGIGRGPFTAPNKNVTTTQYILSAVLINS